MEGLPSQTASQKRFSCGVIRSCQMRIAFIVGPVLFAVATFLVASPLQAQGPAKQLRWKLRPGEALQVSFSQNMEMTTGMAANDVKTVANMGMSMRWDVLGMDQNGIYDIGQTIDRVTMQMVVPGGHNIQYDSAQPGEPQGMIKALASSIDPLIGIDFTQKLSNRGEILQVELSEKSKARLAATPAAAQLQQIFSKDGLKSLLHQAATVLPQNAIRPGESWTGSSETKSPVGNMVMDMTYVYRGTEQVDGRPQERIDVDVKVGFGKDESALGLKVNIAEQKNSGTMYFDAAQGRFTKTDLVQKMKLETKIGEQVHVQNLDTKLIMVFQPAPPRARVQQATATSPVAQPRPLTATPAVPGTTR